MPFKKRVFDPTALGFIKDENHYLEDGNIFLIVENTIFKLYCGLLSKHSTVFATLLEPPFPIKGTERIDGIPAIRLSPLYEELSAESFSLTLDIVLDVKAKTLNDEEIEKVLWVSTMLQFQNAKQWARSSMLKLVPITLPEWRARSAYFASDYDNCAWILDVGKCFDMPMLLPLAYYHLGTMDWSQDITGIVARLEETDYQNILTGKSRCFAKATELLSVLPDFGLASNLPCGKAKRCRGAEYPADKDRAENINEFLNDPLSKLASPLSGLCGKCEQLREASLRKFFDKLPEMFRVDMTGD